MTNQQRALTCATIYLAKLGLGGNFGGGDLRVLNRSKQTKEYSLKGYFNFDRVEQLHLENEQQPSTVLNAEKIFSGNPFQVQYVIEQNGIKTRFEVAVNKDEKMRSFELKVNGIAIYGELNFESADHFVHLPDPDVTSSRSDEDWIVRVT